MDYILDKELSNYLLENEYINFSNQKIQNKVKELFPKRIDYVEKTKIAFEFVRDEIIHNWDNQSERVTKNAAEVLIYKEGMCYAKTMLLAAMLRSQGIYTGFCYQRLSLGEIPERKHVIHALNAVYFPSLGKWIRLDPHRVTNGNISQFSINEDQLAYQIREEYDEKNYIEIYANHVEVILKTLKENSNCIDMINCKLPTRI